MRSTFRTMLVAMVALCALGAVAAASASAALPEFHYLKFPTSFTGAGGEMFFKETGGTYKCKATSISGTISGPKELSGVVIKFNGKKEGGEGGCTEFLFQSEHGEEWWTKELKGRIAYLSSTSKEVGLLLEPVAEPIAKGIHFSVSAATIKGSVIAPITPVNKGEREFTLQYQQGGEHVQQWTHFEGEEILHELSIEWGGSKKGFAMEGSMTITLPMEIELLA